MTFFMMMMHVFVCEISHAMARKRTIFYKFQPLEGVYSRRDVTSNISLYTNSTSCVCGRFIFVFIKRIKHNRMAKSEEEKSCARIFLNVFQLALACALIKFAILFEVCIYLYL